MRNRIVVLAGAAAIWAISTFPALTAEVTGVVKEVNERGNTVILEDDTVYVLPATFSPDVLLPGQTVTITFDLDANGQNVASEIAPQKQ